jgi:hypothetical protein
LNRGTIAAFGLLAVAVLTIFNLLLDARSMKFPDVAVFDSGVAQARPLLPPAGVAGFYNDDSASNTAATEYHLTQYALAPLVIENNVDHPLVIASIHNPQSRLTNPNLDLVRDFKNGVQLLRNKTK